jgi:uncharacterized membrane protein YjjP (DUF1212 family)
MENLKDTLTVAAIVFSAGGTIATVKLMLARNNVDIEKLRENQRLFIEKSAHDAEIKELHDRITKKDDDLKLTLQNFEKELSNVSKEISRIVGFLEGREKS